MQIHILTTYVNGLNIALQKSVPNSLSQQKTACSVIRFMLLSH